MENIFSYSETWGPFQCEAPDCNAECWQIKVTPTEHAALKEEFPDQEGHPDGDRYEMHKAIIYRKMGVAVCDQHRS